ncbi:MAG: polysaccharide pyruvyl transferase CsaB [Clostridia bacterium]|nr:polysaccharide pyruvyl transferase CsaB [Clostridia bacterium]
MANVVFSGYFGFNNAGDEAILYATIKTLKKIDPDLRITVLVNNAQKTNTQYDSFEIEAVDRWSIFEVIKSIWRCDLLISGGGSIIQDVSSVNSPLYYLGVIFIAKLLEKQVMIYSQGIGPVKKGRNRRITAWLFNKADRITVRDQESKEDLTSMGVKREIIVTADAVLGLPAEDIDEELGRKILDRYGISKEDGKKLLGVCIRPWDKNSYLKNLVEVLDKMAESGWKIIFVPMQFPNDVAISRETAKLMIAHEDVVVLRESYSTEEFMAIIKNLDLLVGMRLHPLIISAIVGIPMVGLSYDPKIDRFLRQVGQVALISVDNINSQTLLEMLVWADTNREDILKDMETKRKVLYQKAWQTARIAMSLLNQGKEE